ncbi:MAG: hypothetical protein H6510_00800 [Acidobacteria bacterium]|nr:hypothetical protein [Acidobacteriota bacterium]MCB9396326.1 hypothetical protein [Acidobacteriota bacterium]
MVRLIGLFVVVGWLHAQNPFYLRTFEDGQRALAEKNWPLAITFLEISSFGFLDEDEMFVKALVQLSFAYDKVQNKEKRDEVLFRIRSYFGQNFEKPEGISDDQWRTFQLLSTGKPELVKLVESNDFNALDSYLAVNPETPELWSRYLSLAKTKDQWERARKKALTANQAEFPKGALLEAATRGLKEDATALAERLLRLDGKSSLANEYLGNRAVEKKDWARAERFYQSVTQWSLAESQAMRSLLAQHNANPSPAPNNPPKSTASTNRQDRASAVRAQLDRNDLKAAADGLRSLGEENASDAIYMELYAEYCYRKGDDQLLVDSLGALQTRTPRIRYFLALSHARLGHHQLAYDLLNELSGSDFPELEAKKAELAAQLQKKNSNLSEERRVLERQLSGQKEQSSWQRLIYVLMELNEWTQAQSELSEYQTVFGGMVGNYFRARLDLFHGDFEAAGHQFSELANAGFQQMDTFYFGGVAFFNAKQWALADYMFQRALKGPSEHEKQIQVYLTELRQHNKKPN